MPELRRVLLRRELLFSRSREAAREYEREVARQRAGLVRSGRRNAIRRGEACGASDHLLPAGDLAPSAFTWRPWRLGGFSADPGQPPAVLLSTAFRSCV